MSEMLNDLNDFYEFKMSGGDSGGSNNGGGGTGCNSGCLVWIVIGGILYAIISAIGNR